MVWALPGVARGGPLAVGAYMKEHAWYYDLSRDHEGKFVYQGSPVGEEEHGKYTGWDCTGSFLLAYELPLKTLRLTGKKPYCVTPLSSVEVADVIEAGRHAAFKNTGEPYADWSTEKLFDGLRSWSPVVRKRSAVALAKREGDFVPRLLDMLSGSDHYPRYGALEALGALGPRADAAGSKLRAALGDADPWVQCLAAQAILCLGPEERSASVSDLLALAVATNPADPRRHTALYASSVLFARFPGSRPPAKSILEDSLEGVDREPLYAAIRSLLEHEDSLARGAVASSYRRLSDHDLVALLPDIVRAIEKLAPSNEMFGDGVRLAGLDLLSRLHVREGMNLCVAVIEPGRWGAGKRLPKCLEYLSRYGTHAKAAVPALEEIRATMVTGKRGPSKEIDAIHKCIKAIEGSTATPPLVGLKELSVRAP
jgi:hypothetical protein